MRCLDLVGVDGVEVEDRDSVGLELEDFAVFEGVDVDDVGFSGVGLDGVGFDGVGFDEATFEELDFALLSFDVSFEGLDFGEVALGAEVFGGGDFLGVELDAAAFEGAAAGDAVLEGVTGSFVRLAGGCATGWPPFRNCAARSRTLGNMLD